jgi:hypothetical protein
MTPLAFFDSARPATDKVAATSCMRRFRQDFVLNITPNSSIAACCSSRWYPAGRIFSPEQPENL